VEFETDTTEAGFDTLKSSLSAVSCHIASVTEVGKPITDGMQTAAVDGLFIFVFRCSVVSKIEKRLGFVCRSNFRVRSRIECRSPGIFRSSLQKKTS
jgi:hypothetical protein